MGYTGIEQAFGAGLLGGFSTNFPLLSNFGVLFSFFLGFHRMVPLEPRPFRQNGGNDECQHGSRRNPPRPPDFVASPLLIRLALLVSRFPARFQKLHGQIEITAVADCPGFGGLSFFPPLESIFQVRVNPQGSLTVLVALGRRFQTHIQFGLFGLFGLVFGPLMQPLPLADEGFVGDVKHRISV